MAFTHGVYTSEVDTSPSAPIEANSGLQVCIGTAPVNLAEDPAAAVNVPYLCYKLAEAQKYVGYSDDLAYTLNHNIKATFDVHGVSPIILINVLDPSNSNHVTDVDADDYAVASGKVKINDTGILKSSVVVKLTSSSEAALVEGTDYTLAFDSDGTLIINLITNKTASSLNVEYTKLNPGGVTASDIIGTVNAETGAATGLQLVREIYPRFGLTVGQLVISGFSRLPEVTAAIKGKLENINSRFGAFSWVDISSDSDDSSGTYAVVYTGVKTAKENLGADSKDMAADWPMAMVGEGVYWRSALMAAATQRIDADNGGVPSRSPSNISTGETGACLADGTRVYLDTEQANVLNQNGIVTSINENGYKAWGNRTAAYPSTTDPKDMWICARRVFIWWRNTISLSYFSHVDEAINPRFIENIVNSENIRGNGLVARGYVAAARIAYHPDENPATSIIDGKITFHVYIAPFTPAETIEFLIEYDVAALNAALTEEATD